MLWTSSSFESLMLGKFPLELYEQAELCRVVVCSVVNRDPTRWLGVVQWWWKRNPRLMSKVSLEMMMSPMVEGGVEPRTESSRRGIASYSNHHILPSQYYTTWAMWCGDEWCAYTLVPDLPWPPWFCLFSSRISKAMRESMVSDGKKGTTPSGLMSIIAISAVSWEPR